MPYRFSTLATKTRHDGKPSDSGWSGGSDEGADYRACPADYLCGGDSDAGGVGFAGCWCVGGGGCVSVRSPLVQVGGWANRCSGVVVMVTPRDGVTKVTLDKRMKVCYAVFVGW